MKSLFCILLAASALSLQAAERVVSGAGSLTETIVALGAADELVAVDVSSVYPEAVTKLPKIGYARTLSAEGILSMKPTLVLVTEDAGPPEVLGQIESAGVKVVKLPNQHTPEAAVARVEAVGKALGRTDEAAKLVAAMKEELSAAESAVAKAPERPKVLFIYARGGGVMNVSGTGTAADAIIGLAGGTNAVTEYEHYKPLTAEGAVAAAPDYILVTTRGLQAAGGIDGLLEQPGLALTPAGKEKRVIAMDDLLLLGFGPRLGEATQELFQKLHPAAVPAAGGKSAALP